MQWICRDAESSRADEKAPPSKTEGRAPKIVLGFVVRATRQVGGGKQTPQVNEMAKGSRHGTQKSHCEMGLTRASGLVYTSERRRDSNRKFRMNSSRRAGAKFGGTMKTLTSRSAPPRAVQRLRCF